MITNAGALSIQVRACGGKISGMSPSRPGARYEDGSVMRGLKVQTNGPAHDSGFAAVELLVIVVVLVVLTVLLWPAVSIIGAKSQAVQCLNNHKQLITAFLAYADNNFGNFPANEEGDQTSVDYGNNRPSILPWVNGWENYANGSLGSDTNTQFLVSPSYTSMGSLVRNPAVFKCPADRSRQFGLKGLPRVRSVSMNGAIGCGIFGGEIGVGNWLGGGSSPGNWMIYPKEAAITEPAPANLFIFLDENPDSINDGGFAVENSGINDNGATWVDLPSPLHLGSTAFSFADGHAGLHTWRDPLWRTALDAPPTYSSGSGQHTATGTNRTIDLRWVGEHTSALKPGAPRGPWPWTYVPGP